MKLTFKKGPTPTGLISIGSPYAATEIKLAGKPVGWISPPSNSSLAPEAYWRVWIHKADAAAKCGWRNVRLKATFENEPAARTWIVEHQEGIINLGLKGVS